MKALLVLVVALSVSGCAALSRGGRTPLPADFDQNAWDTADQQKRIAQWTLEAKAEMEASGAGPPAAISLDPCSGATRGLDMAACRFSQDMDRVQEKFERDMEAIQERDSGWGGASRNARPYRQPL